MSARSGVAILTKGEALGTTPTGRATVSNYLLIQLLAGKIISLLEMHHGQFQISQSLETRKYVTRCKLRSLFKRKCRRGISATG